MKHPKPWDGYTDSGNDHGIVRIFDGHIGTNDDDDPESAADIEYRSNIKYGEDADISNY